jgi:SAM-dependent methyltransferase
MTANPTPDVPSHLPERDTRHRPSTPVTDRAVPIRTSVEGGIRLPTRGHLRRTSEVDFVDHYYQGGMGWVLRERLRWVKAVLPRAPVDAVLEIGYGSGVFMYTLAQHARALYGIDVHGYGGAVRDKLIQSDLSFSAAQGSGMQMPFADGSFDVVVIVSALEFMDDPGACLAESLRVTRAGGRVICVTPRILPWADAVYRTLVGIDPESDFKGGRQRVQRALETFEADRRPRPFPFPKLLAPYELVLLYKR